MLTLRNRGLIWLICRAARNSRWRKKHANESQQTTHILYITVSNLSSSPVAEAKDVCTAHRGKYIELSAALNHKVDDLLVGIVTQIRLGPKRLERLRRGRHASTDEDDVAPKSLACMPATKGFIGRLFRKQQLVSRSCDNLLVL